MAFCRFCGSPTEDGSDECTACAESRHPSEQTVPPPGRTTGYAPSAQAGQHAPTGQADAGQKANQQARYGQDANHQAAPGFLSGPQYQPPGVYTSAPYAPQYAPLGAWAFFGYSILFGIPIVGWILVIVFSLNDNNICLRNFARSRLCIYVVIAIVALICVAAGVSILDALF